MRRPNDRTRGMRMRVGLRSMVPALYALDMRRRTRSLPLILILLRRRGRRVPSRIEFSGVSAQSSTCDMQSRGTRYSSLILTIRVSISIGIRIGRGPGGHGRAGSRRRARARVRNRHSDGRGSTAHTARETAAYYPASSSSFSALSIPISSSSS